MGRNSHDYNEDSVTIWVAPRRPSRIPVMLNVLDRLRDSIHALTSPRWRMFLTMLIQCHVPTMTPTFPNNVLTIIRTIRSGVFRLLVANSLFLRVNQRYLGVPLDGVHIPGHESSSSLAFPMTVSPCGRVLDSLLLLTPLLLPAMCPLGVSPHFR